MAGPVVAAAVILDDKITIPDLADSKQLSPAKRYKVFSDILDKAAGYAVAGVSYCIIDKINILQASLLAMRKAVEKLPYSPDIIYVDGNFIIPGLDIKQIAIVGGDKKIPQISAASVLAKVARDTYMYEQSELYPEYGFDRHKGYGTKEHLEILKRIGPCGIHRKSFNPISRLSLPGDN